MKEHKEKYYEVGMDECVNKPINRAELLEAINKVMGEEVHVRVEVEVPENEHQETGETSDINQTGAVGNRTPMSMT